jgi:glycosyltransferase involved in cell wall biosynthesis
MVPVTGLLIVKNEQEFIERALNSLLWCDEILVVDSYSTDETPRICMDANRPWASRIRFIQKEWMGFSAQRNFAVDQARHDWIFFLDGDEQCSVELAAKIRHTVTGSGQLRGVFKVRRQEFFIGKPIRHGIWNPSYHERLFHREGVRFIGEVHEGISGGTPLGQIEEPIIHVEDLKIERFLVKLNHYTTLQAEEDYRRGLRTGFARILLSFPAMLYKNYIYYGAWKDGREGLIISILEGISRTVRHLKIWQIQTLTRRNQARAFKR